MKKKISSKRNILKRKKRKKKFNRNERKSLIKTKEKDDENGTELTKDTCGKVVEMRYQSSLDGSNQIG